MNPKTTLSCALLGAVLIAGCRESAPTGPAAPTVAPAASLGATSDWQEFPVFIDWVGYNRCLDEDIHGTGTVIWRIHVVSTQQDTRQYLFDHSRDDWDWRLIGMTTGDIWLPLPGNRDTYITTASGNLWVWTQRFVYQNQRTGVVLDWPIKAIFVMDANGQVRVDRLEDDACRLRP